MENKRHDRLMVVSITISKELVMDTTIISVISETTDTMVMSPAEMGNGHDCIYI